MRLAGVVPFMLAVLTASTALAEDSLERKGGHWDGSRTTPVHNFAMYDETGQQIVPEYDLAMPMSQKNTCGTCHTYSTVSSGWHFNSSKGNVPAGRPGEPWVIVDKPTGTQLPVSYRDWPGMWNPEVLGITPWEFTNLFARHMPGGDVAEPRDDATPDPDARWDVSGKLEVNCLACHNGSTAQDHSEWALQTARQNFRWAATSAAGLGNVNGMASRLRDSWIIGDGPNPDDNEYAVAPTVDYHDHKFDSKHRTVFDVRHLPPDQNCLQCHSASPVASQRWSVTEDVHSAAGISCAECHRNGLDHMIIRGYETEAKERNDPHVGEFSCAGCHIGSAAGKQTAGGRMGAPVPAHAGIPPVHFEKMDCTACHSGPMPDHKLHQVRTSRANRLGIHGRAQWFTDAPFIVEPVFVRGKSGKIGPHRMMWPAFWATVDGDKLTPLLPGQVTKAGSGILDVEQQIGKVLGIISQDPDAEGSPVLVLKDKILKQDPEGGLRVADYQGTRTVETGMWARETTAALTTLVPEFEPKAELEPEVEARVLATLDLFTKLTGDDAPAVHAGNKLYFRNEQGAVETTETQIVEKYISVVKLIDGAPQPLVAFDALQDYAETAGTEFSLGEAAVASVLQRLDQQATSGTGAAIQHAYVGNGRAFKLTGGKVEAFDHPAAKPVSWAIGHDVRPTAQSLGIKSCAECHSEEAAYLFADVLPTGPLKTLASIATPMHEFQQLDGNFQKLFGMSFKVRSAFKVAMFAIAGLLALLLLVFAALGLRRLTQHVSARN